MCTVVKDVSQYIEDEDRVLPSMSEAQPRMSVDQQSITECDDRIVQSMSVAQPRVSVDQPNNIEVRCQDASVDGKTSDGQYVCTVCTMEHDVCGEMYHCPGINQSE